MHIIGYKRFSTINFKTSSNGHWYFNGAKQDKHLAMFPEELPSRLIKMFSFEGETVLDPFMGSGTTALAARKLGRNSVGYEINPEYIPIIEEKVGEVEIVRQPVSAIDFEAKIDELPYRFVDTHKLDKKIDVKKLRYGSKIDAQSSGKREELFTVKEVIDVDKVRLSNGLVVKLLGVKKNPAVNGEAEKFLFDKTKGKRVFLRFDQTKYDQHDNLLGYLYLENKTFINAHLIKNGVALADTEMDYKYKSKFLTL